MNTQTPQQPERVTETSQEPLAERENTRPTWHAPTITRIDIKRTLVRTGSTNDAGAMTPKF